MKLYFYSAILFTSLLLTTAAQTQFEVDDAEGLEILTTEYYNGESLWGLINGGADLYLEYGFERLTFQKVKFKGINFRVEIYEMSDPNAAFGIFSISKFKCNDVEMEVPFYCVTSYQVQSVKGKFYLSITNEKGNSESQTYSVYLTKILLNKITTEELSLPDYFKDPEYNDEIGSLKIIRGRLGIQNGFPRWESLFENLSNFELFVLARETEQSRKVSAVVRFSPDFQLKNFLEKLRSENPQLSLEVLNQKAKTILIQSQTDG